MSKDIDKFLKALSDGKWHKVEEIFKNRDFSDKSEFDRILKKCEEIDLIEVEEDGGETKNVRGTSFCRKLANLPKERNQ